MPEEPGAEVETTTESESTTPESPQTEAQTEEQKPTKPTETVEFWKAKARDNEKRAKENAAKAEQFDAFTEAQKTKEQKLLERAEAAEGALATMQAAKQIEDWKTQVSKATGVPIDVLRGTSLEELEEHAASVKSLLPEPPKPGSVPAEGRTVTNGSGDPATQFAQILAKARGQ